MAKPKPWESAFWTEPKHNYEAMRARRRAYDAARYAKAIADHLCCRCNEPLPEDYTRRSCTACLGIKRVGLPRAGKYA
jgi:hypothetical protein